MIGQRIESRGNRPWVVLLLLAAGLGLVAAGLISGLHALAAGAVLPLALAGSLWLLGRERRLTATFREEGLEVESAGRPILVPYASIRNIKVGGRLADPAEFRKASCPIAVLHDGGLLRIPSRLNFPSHEVYGFLAEQVPDSGGRDVNPVLADYLERQERYHGPENMSTFCAASRRVKGARRGFRAIFIGLIVGGVAWTVYGCSGLGKNGWDLAGLICTVIGAVSCALSFVEIMPVGPGMKNWKKASLVIGPQGMAMIQGDIQGEVNWPELLEIRFHTNPIGFNFGSQPVIPGILLRVKGANIVIADIYDRPLFVIHDRILAASGRSTTLGRGR